MLLLCSDQLIHTRGLILLIFNRRQPTMCGLFESPGLLAAGAIQVLYLLPLVLVLVAAQRDLNPWPTANGIRGYC